MDYKEALKKDIRSKIPKKIIDELESFNGVIAGGAITSIFTGAKINDIDVYFKNKDDLEKAKEHFKLRNYKLIMDTDNAYTYEIKTGIITENKAIMQFIIVEELIKENPNDLISNFDFTINMAAYDVAKDELFIKDDFFNDNIKRKLIFNENTLYPIISMHRAIKYMHRGYKLDGYEQVKIALAINNLHMKDYRDLRKQLQGIDTTHFKPITDKLMENPETTYKYKDAMDMLSGDING